MDTFSKKERSAIMRAVKSNSNLSTELSLMGLFRKYKIKGWRRRQKIFGKPDFLIAPNIAVFCDSSFWHGREWGKLKKRLPEGYWRTHIENNRKRDRVVTKQLSLRGYVVLRFWDYQIIKNTTACINKIKSVQ